MYRVHSYPHYTVLYLSLLHCLISLQKATSPSHLIPLLFSSDFLFVNILIKVIMCLRIS